MIYERPRSEDDDRYDFIAHRQRYHAESHSLHRAASEVDSERTRFIEGFGEIIQRDMMMTSIAIQDESVQREMKMSIW